MMFFVPDQAVKLEFHNSSGKIKSTILATYSIRQLGNEAMIITEDFFCQIVFFTIQTQFLIKKIKQIELALSIPSLSDLDYSSDSGLDE